MKNDTDLLAARDARPRSAPGPDGSAISYPCSANRQSRVRPLLAGLSGGVETITTGTIGGYCRSVRQGDPPGRIMLLSNNHVFADVNRAPEGARILSPGPTDQGGPLDRIGTLHRYVPLNLDRDKANTVDAAVAILDPTISHAFDICSIGRIAGTGKPEEEMAVCKHGRTTGYTEGVVESESYDAWVGMDHARPHIQAFFQNQIRIVPTGPHEHFALGGDSGSLILHTLSKNVVALYFAGPYDGSYGIASPIAEVERLLEIELL